MIVVMLLVLPIVSLAAPPEISTPYCAASNLCGEVNVTYPFFLAGDDSSATSFCGYPDLRLTCLNGETAVIRLGSDDYAVTEIDYAASEISVAELDVLNATVNVGSCPRPDNLTLTPNSSLSLTDIDANITFFIDCSVDCVPSSVMIGCSFSGGDVKSNQNHSSYVRVGEGSGNESLCGEEYCESVVVVPVLMAAIAGGNSAIIAGDFAAVLIQGFQMRWSTPATIAGDEACRGCEKSEGRCGYNMTSNTSGVFVCFCGDDMRERDCATDWRTIKKIIIGISAGIGGFLLASMLCFLWYRRKNRKFKQKLLSSSSSKSRNGASSFNSIVDDHGSGEGSRYGTDLFSYQELLQATGFFDAANLLGDGGFGTVYKGSLSLSFSLSLSLSLSVTKALRVSGKLRDGRTVAVKRLHESNYKRVEQFMNEVVLLSRLRHPNLVTLYGCTSRHSRHLLLVYDFVPNGTLADHLHASIAGVLTWTTRMSIAVETADALAYLHAVEIIHRDVKSSNILLDQDLHVKVADFGLSRLCPPEASHVSTLPQGTPGYLDPEYHQYYQLTDKSDVYSFGVVLVELISSKPAVDVNRDRSDVNLARMAVNRIQRRQLEDLVDPGIGYTSDTRVTSMVTRMAELAFRCLQEEKDLRPTMREVLEALQQIQRGVSNVDGDREDATVAASCASSSPLGLIEKSSAAAPFSPDSVMLPAWESKYTTPNSSNGTL